jgi:hypothetical protein
MVVASDSVMMYGLIRAKCRRKDHEVRGYTLLRNVRVRGAYSPGTPFKGRKRPYGGFRAPMPHEQRRARCTAF